MTAIGVVGLPDGFVIAADGRATLADESRATATDQERARESYSFTKIFHIHERDKNLAYAMAGTIKMGAMEVLEEIDKQIKRLSRRQFNSARKYADKLCQNLEEEFGKALQNGRIQKLPTNGRTEDGESWKILDIVLVGYFGHLRRIPSITTAQFWHSNGRDIQYQLNSPATPQSIVYIGSEIVRKAMYPYSDDAPDQRFADFIKPTPRTFPEAAEYVKGYVAACSSDLARELDYEHWKLTGGHIHIAKVTPNAFDWIEPPKD